jgi:HD-GYP domain
MVENKKVNISDFVRSLPLRVIGHMYHVGLLTSILAGKFCETASSNSTYRKEELSYYGKAAFLHDIGKAFIPVNILIKSDRFTAGEMEIMKKHTLCAQALFDDMDRGLINGTPEQYIGLARDAAVYHHEWWNGKGYPYGIGNEEIPFIARMVAVCDAYDAITSNRCYKVANTHCYACRELETFSGTQFDPKLVKVFLDNEAEFANLIRINGVLSKDSFRLNK